MKLRSPSKLRVIAEMMRILTYTPLYQDIFYKNELTLANCIQAKYVSSGSPLSF